jgi:hypothetical protein
VAILIARLAVGVAVVDAAWLFHAIRWMSLVTLLAAVVGILVGITGLAWLGYGTKWKAAAQASEAVAATWHEGRDAWQARAERLDVELAESRDAVNDHLTTIGNLKARVAELEMRPDVSELTADVRVLTAALRIHEHKADERTERLIEAIHHRQEGNDG